MPKEKASGGNYQSPKPYPYAPKRKGYQYVSETNPFMGRAKYESDPIRKKFPSAIVTASVLVRKGKIIGKGTNNPIHPSFCPRTVFQCPSGKGYELCPRHCHSDNHSEAQAIKNAREGKHDTKGSDLYLYGHWWCCKPCWDKMIAAGIKNIYLAERATEQFSVPVSGKGELVRPLSYYAASAVTRMKGKRLKIFHQKLATLLEYVSVRAYLPWRYSDPTLHPHLSPREVYERNAGKIRESDFILAYLGEPSLGVGQELEIAYRHHVPVIGLAREGEKISRMALGSPSLQTILYFANIKDAVIKLSEAIGTVVKQKPLRKSKR